MSLETLPDSDQAGPDLGPTGRLRWLRRPDAVPIEPGVCELHLRPFSGQCDHCGDFGCDHCSVPKLGGNLQDRRYCQTCFAAGRVTDWLEAFRQSLWGHRDGSAWLAAIFTGAYLLWDSIMRWPLALDSSGGPIAAGALLLGALSWFAAVLVFYAGARPGRALLLLAPLLRCTLEILVPCGRTPEAAVFEALVAVIFSTILLLDTRNRLFFRLPVSESELRDLYLNLANRWARLSLAIVCGLAILSMALFSSVLREALFGGARLGLLLLLSLVALLCGMVGLRKVNLDITPPVGGRGSALGGMFLSTLWLLFLAAAW